MGGAERALAPLLVVTVAFWITGCEERPTPARPRINFDIVAVGTGPDDPVWHAVRAGLERYDRFDNTVRVRILMPDSDVPLAQKRLLDALEPFDKPTSMCVLTRQAKILVQPIARLANLGIEVVLIGDDFPKAGRAASFRPNHAAVGKVMAKTAASLCESRLTVMAMHSNRLDVGSLLRFEAFADGLRSYGDVSLLRDFDAGPHPGEALELLYATSERYPRLGVWVLVMDWLGRVEPPNRPLVHGSAKIVSLGAHADNLALLERGRVHALVGVDWEDLAFLAAQACRQILGNSVMPVVGRRAEPIVITADNAEAYRQKWAVPTTQRATPTAVR